MIAPRMKASNWLDRMTSHSLSRSPSNCGLCVFCGRFSTEHYVNLYQDRVLQAAQPQLSRRERRRLEVDARLAEVCRARAPTPG